MMNYSELIKQVGQLLWSVMPEDALIIRMQGSVYELNSGGVVTFVLKATEKESWFDFEDPRNQIVSDILKIIEEYKKSNDEHHESWSHFEVELSELGKIKVNFAYILEGDSWAGLYMKGVSDLTREEAKANYIPEKDWADRVKKYKG